MILEAAHLYVKPGTINDFESDLRKASPFLKNAAGYIDHELHKCVEEADNYMLLVKWESITDHMAHFRGSENDQAWQLLLHKYFDKPPAVEHYVQIKL